MNKEKRKRLKLEMKVCIATDSVEINKLWAQWKKKTLCLKCTSKCIGETDPRNTT